MTTKRKATLVELLEHENLFLVHVGHSWVVLRVCGDDSVPGGAVPLPAIVKLFPSAAMVQEIRRIDKAGSLRKCMHAADAPESYVIERLTEPLARSGYEVLLRMSSIGLPLTL